MTHNIFVPQHHLGTLVVDVGGVVGDTLSSFTKHGAECFGLEHQVADARVPSYDLRDWWATPKQFEEVLRSYQQRQNPWASMPRVRAEDFDALLSVYDHANIIFYSEAPPTRGASVKQQVRAFLQREGIAHPQVEVPPPGSSLTLGQVCAVYGARAVLDDNPRHLDSVLAHSPDTLPLLQYYDHNQASEHVHVDGVREFLYVLRAA